jgi:hypothetical protein
LTLFNSKTIMKYTPFKRLLRMLELDRQDIIYVYVYAVLAGIITLSLPLGIQAIIGLIAGGSISSALFMDFRANWIIMVLSFINKVNLIISV